MEEEQGRDKVVIAMVTTAEKRTIIMINDNRTIIERSTQVPAGRNSPSHGGSVGTHGLWREGRAGSAWNGDGEKARAVTAAASNARHRIN